MMEIKNLKDVSNSPDATQILYRAYCDGILEFNYDENSYHHEHIDELVDDCYQCSLALLRNCCKALNQNLS